MDIKIVRKGYDKAQTEAYITQLTEKYEREIEEQKKLILALKDKLIELDSSLKAENERKDLISKALIRAVEKADELEKEAQERYNTEVATLRAFHLRWTSYFNKLVKKYPIDSEISAAKDFTNKVNELFSSQSAEEKEALEEFRREQQKIMGIDPQKTAKNVELNKAKTEVNNGDFTVNGGNFEKDGFTANDGNFDNEDFLDGSDKFSPLSADKSLEIEPSEEQIAINKFREEKEKALKETIDESGFISLLEELGISAENDNKEQDGTETLAEENGENKEKSEKPKKKKGRPKKEK